MKKAFLFSFFVFVFLFVFNKNVLAQTNGSNIGPVLPDPQAGANVVDKNQFSGPVTVINAITDAPHNTVPSKSNNPVILRVNITSGTTNDQLAKYASALSTSEFPHGATIVLGNEENNLQKEWQNTTTSEEQAGYDYAGMFIIFGQALHGNPNGGSFSLAPAPPDFYNNTYSAVEWMHGFFGGGSVCDQINTLVAHVYNVAPADSVGGDPTNTYSFYQTYVSTYCSGKTVSVFGEWGDNPSASVTQQVSFLNTKKLPDGINSATTLIANTCQGGTSQWLYYLPKAPYAFNADGTPVDLSTCGSSNTGPAPAAFIPQQVPCTGTYQLPDVEYHSLRPYPASPCYKQIKQTALFCGNDLVVKNSYKFNSPTGNCTTSSNGDITCSIPIQKQQDNVSIDLTNAHLPILGNTEDVPNATWTDFNTSANNLTAAERMNNYVSWYLNGVVNRAEQDFPPITDFRIFNPDYIVNYSGPLNKLLPFSGQTTIRAATVANAQQTWDKQKSPDDTSARHNQMVACPLPLLSDLTNSLLAIPCYLARVPYAIQFINHVLKLNIPANNIGTFIDALDLADRLTNWTGHVRPLETDPAFQTFTDWFKAYANWTGTPCISSVFGCNTEEKSNVSKVFSYIPYSSTEDRIGSIFTDQNDPKTGLLAHTTQRDATHVTNVSFTPTSGSTNSDPACPDPTKGCASHNLYFAHTQEVAELASDLQNTFAPQTDSTDPNSWGRQLQSDITLHEDQAEEGGREGIGDMNHCTPVQSDTNPGDNLYGDLQQAPYSENRIGGNLTYDANISCTFKVNPFYPGCKTSDPTCQPYTPCNSDVFVSLGIYTKTPNGQEIFDRLVGCANDDPNCKGNSNTMSVFQRFYPKVGPDSPLTSLKDIPGSTTVSYSASGPGDTTAAKAGDGTTDGSQAQIYFPHLGSLEEYFLNGIQKALRPKDLNTQGEANPGMCKPQDPTHQNQPPNSNSTVTDGLIGLALQVSKYTCTPAELLIGVLAKETHGTTYDISSDGKSLLTTQTPLTGDPLEKSYHQYWSLDYWDPLNPNSPLRPDPTHNFPAYFFGSGAYQYSQNDIADQIKSYGDSIQPCLSALSTGADNDTRKVGVAMCVAGAQMWRGTILARSRTCDGAKTLSDLTDQEIANAIITFHGANDGTLDSYLAEVHAFQDAVTTVRGQMAACLNTK